MTELPALREDLRTLARRRYGRRRRLRLVPAALVAAAAVAAALWIGIDRHDAAPDREVAATPTATATSSFGQSEPEIQQAPPDATVTPAATQAPPPGNTIPPLSAADRKATPVDPHSPELADALSLMDKSHVVVAAWSVPGLKGHVLLTRRGGMWCLSAPDPAADQPDAERGVGCIAPSRYEKYGAYIGIGNVVVTVKPDGKTIRIRQR